MQVSLVHTAVRAPPRLGSKGVSSWPRTSRATALINGAHTGRMHIREPEDSSDVEDSTEVEDTLAVMLIGSVIFMMLILYALNWPDTDIRYYASSTLGDAISIFVAVLVFSAVDECLTWLPIPAWAEDVLYFCHFLFWFVLLQGSTAWLSGVAGGEQVDQNAMTPSHSISKSEVMQDKHELQKWRQREVRVKCASRMLAHVSGFAAIAAWSSLQSKTGSLRITLIVPVAAVTMLALCWLSSQVRQSISRYDGTVDITEEIWDSAAREAEGEAVGLVISFLTVNTVQSFVLGVLPDSHGGVKEHLPIAVWKSDTSWMFGCASAAGLVLAITVGLAHRCGDAQSWKKLLLDSVGVYTSMCFAWFLLFGIKAAMKLARPFEDPESLTSELLTALAVSAFVFVSIILLDFVADRIGYVASTQRAVIKIILSFGILTGFAWELCFSLATEVVGERVSGDSGSLDVPLFLGLAFLVTPAYLLHVAPITEVCRRAVVEDQSNASDSCIDRNELD